MRQIVLDTETTGLELKRKHRVIEIGCVELVDRKLTDRRFHTYLNPDREVDEGAFRVHGISKEFLQDKPFFKDIAADFMRFIEGAELVIHNAAFDVAFLNKELELIDWPHLLTDCCTVCDTLILAREKHPGQKNSLDKLCQRYSIDNSKRSLHGALLDAEILAAVYLAMTGGQGHLFVERNEQLSSAQLQRPFAPLVSHSPVITASMEELARHQEFIKFLKKKSSKNNWELQES